MQKQLQVKKLGGYEKITVPKNSTLDLVLEANGANNVEVNVGENATLHILQLISDKSNTVELTNNVEIKSGAIVEHVLVLLNGANVTVKNKFEIAGENNQLKFGTLFLSGEQEKFNLDTQVNHVGRNSTSRVNVYGALKGESQAVSTGNIKIEKTGQGTDAFLASHALLLDKRARCQSVPALEIEANDVKAGHSASTSKLSEEQTFYFETRGFKEKQAEKLIVIGFLQRVFNGMKQNNSEIMQMVEDKWQTI